MSNKSRKPSPINEKAQSTLPPPLPSNSSLEIKHELEEESYGTFVKPTASPMNSQFLHSPTASRAQSIHTRESSSSIYSVSPTHSSSAPVTSSELADQLNTDSTETTEKTEILNSETTDETTNDTETQPSELTTTTTTTEQTANNVSSTEWTGSYQGSDEFLRKIFNFMDYDNDGLVNLDEVKRTLNILNDKFKRNYVELSAIVFLNTFDRNKDGYIDFDEFKLSIREILSLK